MAQGFRVLGADGLYNQKVRANGESDVTIVDASGNPIVSAEGAAPSVVSGLPIFGLNDATLLPVRADRLGGLATAAHAPLLHDSFEGTTVHPLRWLATATTMAATQATISGLTINSGAITTINTGYMLQSVRRVLKQQRSPIQAKFRARIAHVNNSVMEIGFGDAATFNGANTAGAYWQVTSGGVVQPVLTFNGSDITGVDVRSLLDLSRYYTWDVFVDDDEATFTVQDTSTGLLISRQKIRLPLTAQRLWSATQVQLLARLYNTGVAPASASQLFVTDAYCAALDAANMREWASALAGTERGFNSHPFTGAQLHQWANSAAAANATLSNTAAGYTTLGGLFQFAAVAGAVTDYALFGFQVPAPANLVVTGIDIEAWNTGAAVATTPTLLNWGLGVGSTAVSLATATVTRVPIGAQSLPIGAVPGAKAERISKQFKSPLFCGAGRFLHVILRMPVGTATASQVVAGMVGIEGHFE
jgi:hypothetical protein